MSLRHRQNRPVPSHSHRVVGDTSWAGFNPSVREYVGWGYSSPVNMLQMVCATRSNQDNVPPNQEETYSIHRAFFGLRLVIQPRGKGRHEVSGPWPTL